LTGFFSKSTIYSLNLSLRRNSSLGKSAKLNLQLAPKNDTAMVSTLQIS